MKRILLSFFFLCFVSLLQAQTVTIIAKSVKSSLRGLSVVDDKTVWVSGSSGTVGLSTDSGNTWKWMKVAGFEKTDFRDIEAFDNKTAVIMGIDTPGIILKTTDGMVVLNTNHILAQQIGSCQMTIQVDTETRPI